MGIEDLIASRRSIKTFTDRPIERDAGVAEMVRASPAGPLPLMYQLCRSRVHLMDACTPGMSAACFQRKMCSLFATSNPMGARMAGELGVSGLVPR